MRGSSRRGIILAEVRRAEQTPGRTPIPGKEFTMDRRCCAAVVLFVAVAALGPPGRTQNPAPAKAADDGGWTMDFPEERGDLGPTGRNRYFILEPGYRMVLRKGDLELIKAVLPET